MAPRSTRTRSSNPVPSTEESANFQSLTAKRSRKRCSSRYWADYSGPRPQSGPPRVRVRRRYIGMAIAHPDDGQHNEPYRRKSGSQRTHRWREMDSNHRSPGHL
jgi:hypothetical protein